MLKHIIVISVAAFLILKLITSCTSEKPDTSNVFDPLLEFQSISTRKSQAIINLIEQSHRSREGIISELLAMTDLRITHQIPNTKKTFKQPINTNNLRAYILSLDSIDVANGIEPWEDKKETQDRLFKNLDKYTHTDLNNLAILSDLLKIESLFLDNRAVDVELPRFGRRICYLNTNCSELKIGSRYKGVLTIDTDQHKYQSISYDTARLTVNGIAHNADYEEVGGALLIEFDISQPGEYHIEGAVVLTYFNNSENFVNFYRKTIGTAK